MGSHRHRRRSNLTEGIEALRVKYGIPGTIIAVSSRDENVTESLSFGIANTRGDSVTEDSLFGIGSNSKLFAMLSVGMLVENNTILASGERLDWSTKIKDILPEWKLMDEYASNHADVVDLMRMPRHDCAPGKYDSASDMVSKMRHLRPSSEIRQAFQYNNQHYVTLSNIITKLTGIPYIDYVKQHIFDPLGMNSTTFNVTEAKLRGDRTDGYMRAGRNQTRCAEAASLNRPSMRFGSTFA